MTQSSADDEAVVRFYELLEKTTSVRVVKGSSISSKRKNDAILFAEKSDVALSELRDALRIRPLGARLALMTPGDPTLALSGDDGSLLTIQYLGQAPDVIRSAVLPEDALLLVPDALHSWLTKYGARAAGQAD